MSWPILRTVVDAATAERLSDALVAGGALSCSILDARAGTPAEQSLFGEPGEPAPGLWASCVLVALYDDGVDALAAGRSAVARLGLEAPPALALDRLEDQDWVRVTQASFPPVPVSDRLWVVAPWHQAEGRGAAVQVVIDPGAAFGTGTHPTTRLCLEWLSRNIRGGETVLDWGCGSGILALAAAKLGAGRVVGVDLDPEALRASQENAERNQVDIWLGPPARVGKVEADVTVANILLNPLRRLAPQLARQTRRGGRLVVSGLLGHQVEEVREAYARWFHLEEAGAREGWVCLAGERGTGR
jgi:ribosomal protein L11 methyltransferase